MISVLYHCTLFNIVIIYIKINKNASKKIRCIDVFYERIKKLLIMVFVITTNLNIVKK